MLLIMHNKWFSRSGAARGRMHRNVVNSRIANIFKRIPQTQNSTGNGKRFAKMRRRKMCGSCVYHAGINHAARSSELYDLFRPGNLLFQRQGKVESRCGAVTVGRTYLFPPLSSGGDLCQRAELLTALASSPRRRIGASVTAHSRTNERISPHPVPLPMGEGTPEFALRRPRGPIFHSAGPGENCLGERASFSFSPVFPPRGSRFFNRSAIHWKVT